MAKREIVQPNSLSSFNRGKDRFARFLTMSLVTGILVYIFIDIIFGK